ncbi:MAG: response regulator transcription factor [Clostridiales bacterium]|jgi:DNA-binding response OmpR family regulator|nr:response regulator transcription factor [Clostridiales bacterium]
MNTILAIDADISVYNQQKTEWERYGVDIFRVNTINEAIIKIMNGMSYLFVAINEDSIPDYMTLLPILRESTRTPIFIITSTFLVDKKVKALQLGADVYEPFTNHVKDNIFTALEVLKAQDRWANRHVESPPILCSGNIFISSTYRKVFIKNEEIHLTAKEYELLYYFVKNKGIFLSYDQIFNNVWCVDYDKYAPDIISSHIKRLRKKLMDASPEYKNIIENVYGVGYRFCK